MKLFDGYKKLREREQWDSGQTEMNDKDRDLLMSLARGGPVKPSESVTYDRCLTTLARAVLAVEKER